MTVASVAKYIIADKKIQTLEAYANHQGNEWVLQLDRDKEQTLPYPVNCISVYYRLDTTNKTLKERLCMANYHAKYERDFKAISVEWLSEYFSVEEGDLVQLDNPYTYFVKPGGELFILVNEHEQVVGGTAMIVDGEHLELAKMGVKKEFGGQGYANLLMFEAIQWAKTRPQYRHIDIHTAKVLKPAVALYKKFGFYVVPLDEVLTFDRVDLQMKLDL